MPKLFISYRRVDSEQVTGRLYDRLVLEYGEKAVFKDVDSIKTGVDFRDVLDESLNAADVVLVIIGSRWLGDESVGERRIDLENDFVRMEIEKSLSRKDVQVIPLLVTRAKLPASDELPESIRDLTFRNAEVVRPDPDFHNDMDRLIRGINKDFPRRKWLIPSAATICFLLAGAVAVGIALKPEPVPKPESIVSTPKSIASITKSKSQRVANLLVKANNALTLNLLTTTTDSVQLHARQLKMLDPNNTEIRVILDKVVAKFQDWAEKDLSNKKFDKAQIDLNKSGSLINEFSLQTARQQQLLAELQSAKQDEERANPVVTEPNKQPDESPVTEKDVLYLANNMVLKFIPAGRFDMGYKGASKESPVHDVKIDYSFWMSSTEITFEQYDAYRLGSGTSYRPSAGTWGRQDRPVINVSWHDTQGYIRWLNTTNGNQLKCRLPSESEWEYAARADSPAPYFWGDFIGTNNAHCKSCGSAQELKKTAPVKHFQPNKFGLYDMHGNVWEWVQDVWQKNYLGAPSDGSAWQAGDSDAGRVIRGGSWSNEANLLRASYRLNLASDNRNLNTGFRVVCMP